MTHTTTVGPSLAKIVGADGTVSELTKQRTPTQRARCTCGWLSAEYTTYVQARAVGQAHEKLMGEKK